MSEFKFKSGDLVEITRSDYGNKGNRFIVGDMAFVSLKAPDGTIAVKGTNSYESNIPSKQIGYFKWTAECNLKLVNQDIDSISDSTFSEILNDVTSLESIIMEK